MSPLWKWRLLADTITPRREATKRSRVVKMMMAKVKMRLAIVKMMLAMVKMMLAMVKMMLAKVTVHFRNYQLPSQLQASGGNTAT